MKALEMKSQQGKSGEENAPAIPREWVQNDYVIRVLNHPSEVSFAQWTTLLAAERRQGRDATPFVTPEYLAALQDSGSAVPATGWTLQLFTAWTRTPDTEQLSAAAALYVKSHSYGEYVFDWAWADAYARHGLAYYPKAVVAVPFTPAPGPRLLAVDVPARQALMAALLSACEAQHLSSLHMLFAHPADVAVAQAAGLMLRHTVQFHWTNRMPEPYRDFDDFLASLSQDKRKKIRQERRKVADASVRFRTLEGNAITPADWDFFYRCYERTYLEHGNVPYLSRAFFAQLADTQADNWVLFVAETDHPVACSLIAINSTPSSVGGENSSKKETRVAFGRYWGALERVDCLHFEACYYQPLVWCIANGIHRFEGGAQGEHKMARALLPVQTTSAHWLAHPAFSDAVDRYLQREGEGIASYLSELNARSPFRQTG
jgi:hypothetical protein